MTEAMFSDLIDLCAMIAYIAFALIMGKMLIKWFKDLL